MYGITQQQIEKTFCFTNNFERYGEHKSISIIDNTKSDYDITIAIPTYKRPDLLIEAIESAINQKDVPVDIRYEILVVDNDPQRQSETERVICNRYSSIQNFRYYKNEENLRVFGNWNRCFELAHAKWILLLHDDDLLCPQYIFYMHSFSKKMKDAAIIKPALKNWYDNGEAYQFPPSGLTSKKYYQVCAMDYIFMGNFFGAPTCCLFNKELIKEAGGFTSELEPCGDIATIFHLAMHYKVYLLKQILGIQRIGKNETVKPNVLSLFMEVRYNMTIYLINRYHLNWLLRKWYLIPMIHTFYHTIQKCWNKDFDYDVSLLQKGNLTLWNYFFYRNINFIYKFLLKIRNLF